MELLQSVERRRQAGRAARFRALPLLVGPTLPLLARQLEPRGLRLRGLCACCEKALVPQGATRQIVQRRFTEKCVQPGQALLNGTQLRVPSALVLAEMAKQAQLPCGDGDVAHKSGEFVADAAEGSQARKRALLHHEVLQLLRQP